MRFTFSLLILLGFYKVFAQQTDTSISITEVEIQGNRIAMPFSKTNRNVALLEAKEITQLPVYTPQEALSYIAGVDIRSRGVFGIQSDVGIRGGSFEQTQVLLNGLKLSDPQTGHHMLNLPLPLNMIKRMEVLKGPGAIKYGQNAFSGAINLVVEPFQENLISVSGMYGEHNTYSLSAAAYISSKNYNQLLGISKQSSDGYRKNADFENNQVFYMGQLKKENITLDVLGGGSWRKFGAGGFYVADSEEYEEVNTLFGGVKLTYQNNGWMIKPQAYYRYNDDHYVYIRSNPNVFQNFHTSNVFGAEIHTSYTSKFGVSGFGLEYRNEDLNSTNLGIRNRNISGIFLEHRYYNGGFSVTPGFYLNNYSDFGSFGFPAIDAGFEFSDKLSVYASAGKSFRVPSYTDLYYKGRNNIGNPTLTPEQALTYEGGFKYKQNNSNFQLGVFNRNASELIDWVKQNPADPWQPQNFYEVNVFGVEAQAQTKNKSVFGLNILVLSIDYTYINADLLNSSAASSRYSLSNLRHQIVGRLVHQITGNLYHSISYRYIERVALPSYHLLDDRLFWQGEKLQVFADVTNLTNTQYTEAGFVPMPGRWFKVGFTWDINL